MVPMSEAEARICRVFKAVPRVACLYCREHHRPTSSLGQLAGSKIEKTKQKKQSGTRLEYFSH